MGVITLVFNVDIRGVGGALLAAWARQLIQRQTFGIAISMHTFRVERVPANQGKRFCTILQLRVTNDAREVGHLLRLGGKTGAYQT